MAITSKGLKHLGHAQTDFSLQDEGEGVYIKEWLSDQPQPSEAEIETADAQAQAEYDSKQYARDRAKAYPSLTDQADMAYWDRQNGTTTLDDAISAVKLQFPKG